MITARAIGSVGSRAQRRSRLAAKRTRVDRHADSIEELDVKGSGVRRTHSAARIRAVGAVDPGEICPPIRNAPLRVRLLTQDIRLEMVSRVGIEPIRR